MDDRNAQKPRITPEGYTSLTPWIISPNSASLIEFMKGAFDAQEIPNSRITNSDGIIIHVVLRIGGSMVMLFDSRDGWRPSPAYLNLYVEDVEATYRKALTLGAISVTDMTTLWFGEKVCRILDPFGNLWWLNERVEEVDFTDPGVAQRAATSEAQEGIAYIQKSLHEAFFAQKAFFGTKT